MTHIDDDAIAEVGRLYVEVGIDGVYFERSGCFAPPVLELRTAPDHRGDPLWAVWATRR